MVTQTPNLSLSAKREALACIHGRYARAGRPHKTRILDEFGATCGYHRKAALRLLNRLLPAWPPKRRSLKPAGGSAAITEDFDQAVPQFRFNAEGAEVSQSDSPLRSSAPTSASLR